MLKEATDEKLMEAVAGGDLDAFDEIVIRYQALAWKTACRFLGDSMEAEDAAQDAFLRILEAAARYRATGAFRNYFYRTLTHICIDRTRKRHPASIDDIPDVPDRLPGPPEILIDKERRARVRKALDTLPPNQKFAIILKHYEGLSYTEIAEILGVTPKAVEGLIRRAAASLQVRLSPLERK